MTDEIDKSTGDTESVIFKEIGHAKVLAFGVALVVAFFAWAAGSLLQYIL